MRKDLGSSVTDITGTDYDYVRMIPPNGIIACIITNGTHILIHSVVFLRDMRQMSDRPTPSNGPLQRIS